MEAIVKFKSLYCVQHKIERSPIIVKVSLQGVPNI